MSRLQRSLARTDGISLVERIPSPQTLPELHTHRPVGPPQDGVRSGEPLVLGMHDGSAAATVAGLLPGPVELLFRAVRGDGAGQRVSLPDCHRLLHQPITSQPMYGTSASGTRTLAELIVQICGKRPEVPLPFTGQGAREYPEPETATVQASAEHLARGGILLVHNGASEIGPRAVGHRSFLARATSVETKRLLSERVKGREWYRPVAPVVRQRDCAEFFRGPSRSDYMLFSFDACPSWVSEIPGCVHVDATARVQTLPEGADPFLEALLECYGRRHGLPVLLNTSLNLKGEPLADDIRDSYRIVQRIAASSGSDGQRYAEEMCSGGIAKE